MPPIVNIILMLSSKLSVFSQSYFVGACACNQIKKKCAINTHYRYITKIVLTKPLLHGWRWVLPQPGSLSCDVQYDIFCFGDDFTPALQEQKETRRQLTSAVDDNNNESMFTTNAFALVMSVRARVTCIVLGYSVRYYYNTVLRYYLP